MSKDACEIAGDITVVWMQLLAQDTAVKDLPAMLSQERVSDYFSGVCKTIVQCAKTAQRSPAVEKPKGW